MIGRVLMMKAQKGKHRVSTVLAPDNDLALGGVLSDRPEGWKMVQKCLPRIIEYGRSEGILVTPPQFDPVSGQKLQGGMLPGLVQQQQQDDQEEEEKTKQSTDKVNLPTHDISMIHEAIPFLPVPCAVLCLLLNIVLPGTGTLLSGVFALCLGQPRINLKEGRKFVTLLLNTLVGIAQFFTVTFLLVGWCWSVGWGGLLLIHSMQYRDALRQRRQEAVATAAIEALTKDSILHRKDVKTLVKDHKTEIKNTKKSKRH